MNIGKYCTRNVITAHKENSIMEAADLMRRHHIGVLVIVDGNRPTGILTDRDIVMEVIAEEIPLDSVAIEDVMTRSPVTGREDDDIFTTMEMMRKKGIRRLPVTDSLGLLVGIVTTDDLLQVIYEEMGNIISLITREQVQEQKNRGC